MTPGEKLIRAKDATTYDLLGMPDERFELMVSRLVRIEFPRAFKPANRRDRGADMVLHREDGKGYERCWQSKHFTGAIKWDQCKESLKAAREHWKPEHYTFVFPRELNGDEQKTFDKHFGDIGITVDHWSGEELQFRLCGSDAGQRVARTFFDDVELDRELTYRAIEAAGRVDTPMHVLDRALNLGRALAGKDAYFSYPNATHETDGPGPGVTPGTVMSVSESDGTVTSRLDIVPRDEEAMELYGPQFELSATDDEAGRAAAERLREALTEGTFAEIDDGLEVTFTRLPPALAELVGERLSGGTIQIGPARSASRPSWNATLRAATDAGTAVLELGMRASAAPPDGWDVAFRGERGGLTATLMLRGKGSGHEARLNLRYTRGRMPVREQLGALTFLKAASGAGELTVADSTAPDGSPMRFPTDPEPLSDDARGVLVFMENVRVIEEWTGTEFSLPDDISAEDARDVAVVAKLVRDRGRRVTWNNIEMTVTSSRPLRAGQLVRVEVETSAAVLGRVVDLGYLRSEFSDYTVVDDRPASRAAGHRLVRMEPGSEAAADIVVSLVKEKTNAKRRPPPPPPRKGNRRKRRKKGRR